VVETELEWAAILDVSAGTLFARKAYGWPDRRMLETPVDDSRRGVHRRRILTYRGRRLSVHTWSMRTGIKVRTLLARLRRGWSAAKALSP